MPVIPLLPDFDGGLAPDQSQNSQHPERNLTLPWNIDPVASWIDYRCWVEIYLDAGMALHKPLPQSQSDVDTLAPTNQAESQTIDSFVPRQGGVNITSSGNGVDVIQRMATSTYIFVLVGWGERMGYQIPIPSLLSVGNVTPVPKGVQYGKNVIVGNYAGIPKFYAEWRLPYMIPFAPSSGDEAVTPVPDNPALHIRSDAQLPPSMRLPWTQADQRFIRQGRTLRTIRGGIGPSARR